MVGVGLSLGFVSTGYLSYPFLAIVYIMHPYPQKTYMWTKGNYQVTAIGRSELLTRYEERIHRWEWEKIEGGEKLAPNNN